MVAVKEDKWSPYTAGALTGLLMVISVWLTGKYFGASTSFVRSAGMIENLLSAERVKGLAYFAKEAPIVDWQWMFVVGIFFGAMAAARFSATFRLQAVPDLWKTRFGPSRARRAMAAFLGGVLAMYGARLADG